MALPAGTPVFIADDESVSGTGLSRAIFDAVSTIEQANQPLPTRIPSGNFSGTLAAWLAQINPARLRILRAWARQANAHATGVTARAFVLAATVVHIVASTDDIVLVDGLTAGGAVVVTLPLAANFPGRVIVVKNQTMGGFSSLATRSGGDTVDGAASVAVAGDFASVAVVSDGVTSWHTI